LISEQANVSVDFEVSFVNEPAIIKEAAFDVPLASFELSFSIANQGAINVPLAVP
jgi:hypothetical protein